MLGLVIVFSSGEYILEDIADIESCVAALVPNNGASTVFLAVGRGSISNLTHATELDGLAVAPLGHDAAHHGEGFSVVRLGVVVRLLGYDDHELVVVDAALCRHVLDRQHARTSVVNLHSCFLATQVVRFRGAEVLLIWLYYGRTELDVVMFVAVAARFDGITARRLLFLSGVAPTDLLLVEVLPEAGLHGL